MFSPCHRSPKLRQFWTPRGKTIVGYCGRLAPEKSVDILRHLASDDRVQIVIIGDGPDRERLSKLMPQAVFTGRLVGDALSQALASLDILVASGERETFCQVIQESMASGVPVVAPARGGPLDLIEHGVNGLLYPPGDSGAMVEQVLSLAFDARRRRQLALLASERVQGRSWSAIGQELIGHYESLVPLSTVRLAA